MSEFAFTTDSDHPVRDRTETRNGNHGFQAFQGPRCAVCQSALTVHEQAIGRTCSQARCKSQFLREELKSKLERDAAVKRRALEVRRKVAAEAQIEDEESLGIGIVPSNDRRLTNVPEKRVRKFRERLMRVITEAFTEAREFQSPHWDSPDSESRCDDELSDKAAGDGSGEPELGARQLAVLGGACATCRGHCCPQGGDHAFIQIETIHRYLQTNPGQRPREILEAYLSLIGPKAYDGSCLYHSARGCRLPRDMRSSICNGFLCKGLSHFLFQLPESADRPAFVVATDDDEVVRSAIIDGDRIKEFASNGQGGDRPAGGQDEKPGTGESGECSSDESNQGVGQSCR